MKKHYSGDLGTFTYDNKEFSLVKAPEGVSQDYIYDEVLDLHEVYFYADKTVSPCNWYKIYQRFKLKEPPILSLTNMSDKFNASCKDNYSVEANFYNLCKTQ